MLISDLYPQQIRLPNNSVCETEDFVSLFGEEIDLESYRKINDDKKLGYDDFLDILEAKLELTQ
jgi:hypothetical protein